MNNRLTNLLLQNQQTFKPVVSFDAENDKLLKMDFTSDNVHLSDSILADTTAFTTYVFAQLENTGAKYGIGGYDEHRTIYSRSKVFDTANEPRRLHLGVDIWGVANTPIYAPLNGIIHSFKFNDNFGDYGATIILQHQLGGLTFHTLYGHLSLKDIIGLQNGTEIIAGTEFAHFGEAKENGNWPPHLHFQLIENMYGKEGDYPGVCKFSEREQFLENSPDPDIILQMLQHATP